MITQSKANKLKERKIHFDSYPWSKVTEFCCFEACEKAEHDGGTMWETKAVHLIVAQEIEREPAGEASGRKCNFQGYQCFY